MNTPSTRVARRSSALDRIRHGLAAAAVAMLTCSPAVAEIAQTPLYLGGGNVPGNLTLVPSVEWPTVNSMASLGEYDAGRTYLGYFDPNKCYLYSYSATEANRHFYPVGWAYNRLCNKQWSGNFMNWAATQTIDPFRSVLTGGLRVRDTTTETWLEKARHDGQGGTGIYPNRRLPGGGDNWWLLQLSTPFDGNWMRMRIQGLGNELRFRIQNDGVDSNVTDYNPANPVLNDRAYRVSVRVKVCVPGLLEANCRLYPNGSYKPEGLIQQYSEELRIGVFGYLNDHNMLRDGGVLRARQKFVGPTRIDPGVGEVSNPGMEWNPNTGILIQNPDSADAAATAASLGVTIDNSGAINYLNKFGQLTSNTHKSYDPVSELYYTAMRYLKNQGNVPQYTNIPGNTGVNAAQAADRFPVITNWEDPMQYACQKNVVLGIGDVYTHRDKNLPGSGYNADEPTKPSAVANDNTVNVVTETNKVASMEGIGIGHNPFTGRQNSAFMAGLAWDANTRDVRDDLPGTQTISTHWVDVLEAQSLEPPVRNQYYLATKYGGFRVPEDFDPDAHTGALPLDWWHSNGDTLASFGRGAPAVSFPRPDNYYVAGEADQMIESLTQAFARISAELRSSASSVAANSTRLGSDTAVFQASFDSTNWNGELEAFRILDDGSISTSPSWSAGAQLDALSDFNMGSRNILTITPPTSAGGGSLVSTTGGQFTWAGLTTAQQDALRQSSGGGPLVGVDVAQDRLDFLRGVRGDEQPDGPLRTRDSRLGDIVNSDPQFVHKQDFGYVLLDQSAAFYGTDVGEDYKAFRESGVYQNRPPMIIVGANDGMLHGFDATISGAGGGAELFAFVPDASYENLYELTLPEYSHRFFVDASPRVSDAWFAGSWHTIAVASTGAGGKSVFALDVTNPNAMSDSSVLWEFTHPSMGYTIGQSAVVALPSGEFGVVVTSGYETGVDDGMIWILDPADGSIIHSITVTDSGDLGQPLVADLNSDRVADRIYVGDSDGNLWRFDLAGSTPSGWQPPVDLRAGGVPLPLFVARDAGGTRQAITAPLASAFNEDGLHTVFFGTGSFYRVDDNVIPDDPAIDSFYAVIDRGEQIAGRGDLLEQSIIAETPFNGTRVRGVTAHEMQSGHAGWYMDLLWSGTYGGPGPAGERVVSRATVRGDRVIFATLIPNPDPCAFGGDSWIMELNTFTGGRLAYAVFDLNGDGLFDESDWITVTDENGNDIKIPPSAIAPDINIVKTPAIIAGVGENQDEVKVMSGSSGELIRISERGAIGIGRQSWRQLR